MSYGVTQDCANLGIWIDLVLTLHVGSLNVCFEIGSNCLVRFCRFVSVASGIKNESIVGKLLKWYRKNARDLPWRKTTSPYGIWVSEIMLQQTQVKTVIPFWERWMRELPTIGQLADVEEDRLLKLWEGLGYYRRARNLQKGARYIEDERGGVFPDSHEGVLEICGVGRYTAGAICSIAFDQPEPLVDGNVIRVLSRLFEKSGDPKEKGVQEWFWQKADELVKLADVKRKGKQRSCSDFNQSMMELGATVCSPSKPSCSICPVKDYCSARESGTMDSFPELAKRPKTTKRRFIGLVVEREGGWLLGKRPGESVNGGLWEFPNKELKGNESTTKLLEEWTGRSWSGKKPFKTVRHSITRYRIQLDVFRLVLEKGDRRVTKLGEKNSKWVTDSELEALPLSSAHSKIRSALLKEA